MLQTKANSIECKDKTSANSISQKMLEIAKVKIRDLRLIYDQWISKFPQEPFRIVIAHSPGDPKQEGENWGALLDAIVKFAQETGAKTEVTIVAGYGALGATTYVAEKEVMGEQIEWSTALACSLAQGEEWKKEHCTCLEKKILENITKTKSEIKFETKFWSDIESNIPPHAFLHACDPVKWGSSATYYDKDQKKEISFAEALDVTAQDFAKKATARIVRKLAEIGKEIENPQEAERMLIESSKIYLMKESGPMTYIMGKVFGVNVVLYPEEASLALKAAREIYIKNGLLADDLAQWVSYDIRKIKDLGRSENNVARAFRDRTIQLTTEGPRQRPAPMPAPSTSKYAPFFGLESHTLSRKQKEFVTLLKSPSYEPTVISSMFQEMRSEIEMLKNKIALIEARDVQIEEVHNMLETLLKLKTQQKVIQLTPPQDPESYKQKVANIP